MSPGAPAQAPAQGFRKQLKTLMNPNSGDTDIFFTFILDTRYILPVKTCSNFTNSVKSVNSINPLKLAKILKDSENVETNLKYRNNFWCKNTFNE